MKKGDVLIQLEKINKHYIRGEEKFPVLHDVSLRVKKGDFLAIMGQSGSGKSTLLNIIGLLDNANSGKYFLDGKDVSGLDEYQQSLVRGKRISFVFQQYNLIPRMTVLKQVALPLFYQGFNKEERLNRAREALKKVNLENFSDRKPNELSGGQQQRVTIARAIITNPDIILADEPTGALDSKTGEDIMKIFHNLHNDGSTIVMITHEKTISQHAEKIIHLVDGQIVNE